MKRLVSAAAAASALALGTFASPAASQPVVTGGLVNVTIVDAVDVEDVNVAAAVPISVAAAICGVQVGVIAEDLEQGPVECQAGTGDQTFSFTQA